MLLGLNDYFCLIHIDAIKGLGKYNNFGSTLGFIFVIGNIVGTKPFKHVYKNKFHKVTSQLFVFSAILTDRYFDCIK